MWSIITSGLCDAVTMTPIVALVFLERSVASSPMRNMMWSRCSALVLKPAVPYCRTRPAGFGCSADFWDTSSNWAMTAQKTPDALCLSCGCGQTLWCLHCAAWLITKLTRQRKYKVNTWITCISFHFIYCTGKKSKSKMIKKCYNKPDLTVKDTWLVHHFEWSHSGWDTLLKSSKTGRCRIYIFLTKQI